MFIIIIIIFIIHQGRYPRDDCMFVSEKAIFWLKDEEPESESMDKEPWDLMVAEPGLVLEWPETEEMTVLLGVLVTETTEPPVTSEPSSWPWDRDECVAENKEEKHRFRAEIA